MVGYATSFFVSTWARSRARTIDARRKAGGDPTDEHRAVASAADVAHEVADEAVEIRDHVRLRPPHSSHPGTLE